MPLKRCTLEGRPGWQFGAAGKCYTYAAGDDVSEAAAKKKAIKQAIAIGGGKPPAEGLSELYRLAESAKAGERIPMMLFPIGIWKSAKYPKLSLTRELAEAVIANFEANVLGTEPVVDSSGKHDTAAEAAGWIKDLRIAPTKDGGEALFADWEPTDLGAAQLNEKRYQYNSVEIGEVVDNVTGVKTTNVLRSVTLTNTPILRMLPPVLEAGEAIAASEPIEVALSELEPVDPVTGLIDDIDALLAKLDDNLKGKAGIRAMRTYLRETRAKASAHATLAEAGSTNDVRAELERALQEHHAGGSEGLYIDDFGPDWVVYHVWSAGPLGENVIQRASYMRDANGITFGQPIEVKQEITYIPPSEPSPSGGATGEALADGTCAAGVGVRLNLSKERSMSDLTELLKLSESDDDALILAEVKKVITENATFKAKFAEGEKAERVRKLDEAIAGTHVLPAEKDVMLALAESAPGTFDATLKAREDAGVKLVDTSERGNGTPPPEPKEYADPSIELAEKAQAKAKADDINYGEAMRLVMAADPTLAERYVTIGKEV